MDKNSDEVQELLKCRRAYMDCKKEEEVFLLENTMLAIQDFLMSIGFTMQEIRNPQNC